MLTYEQKLNIKNQVELWEEDLLFYFQEYGTTYELCHLFCEEFTNYCQKLFLELRDREKEEEIEED